MKCIIGKRNKILQCTQTFNNIPITMFPLVFVVAGMRVFYAIVKIVFGMALNIFGYQNLFKIKIIITK